MNRSTGLLDTHDLIWAWPQLLVFVKSIQSAEEPLHPALKCHARRAFQSGGAKLKMRTTTPDYSMAGNFLRGTG